VCLQARAQRKPLKKARQFTTTKVQEHERAPLLKSGDGSSSSRDVEQP